MRYFRIGTWLKLVHVQQIISDLLSDAVKK
jgi:hypothetical protein